VILALLGDPVEHSRSPAIHTAALAAVGLEGRYEARRVDAAGMRTALDEIRTGRLAGANVTMPHKALAAALADRSTEVVTRTGAANTLRGERGVVAAENTDVGGLCDVWREAGFASDAPVHVIGSGGAAAAALVAFADRDPTASARRPPAAAALAARVGVHTRVVPWGDRRPDAVLVNATPLGMRGEALPDRLLDGALGLIDLPYGSAPTPAVVAARSAGIPVADGIAVLVAQAARSFTWWTECEAPLAVMRRAAG
jgi:shikimate dehydrogenase